MTSPRTRYQDSSNAPRAHRNTTHYQSYELSGEGGYESVPPRNQDWRDQGCCTSPYSRKQNGRGKFNRYQTVKSLKGMVNCIIEDKKVNTSNVVEEFNTLKTYQRQILDGYYDMKKRESPLDNINPQATPRSYQSNPYQSNRHPRESVEGANPPTLDYPYKNRKTQNQKIPKDMAKKIRTQKTEERLLQSTHLKRPNIKPTHKRKQSSQLFIQRPYSLKEENEILKEENMSLREELKKSKAYIRLLEREVRELNQHILTIENSDGTQQNYELQAQIRLLNNRIKQLSEHRAKDRSSQEISQLTQKIKGFQQQNESLKRNMMKLLSSKLQLISDQQQPGDTLPAPSNQRMYVGTPTRIISGTSKKVPEFQEDTNLRSKESASYDMANLLNECPQRETRRHISSFQY